MSVEIRILGAEDSAALSRVAAGTFDQDVDLALAVEFLRDPRHHIAVASDDGVVVGFASAVHYVHPDKPAELWINEVGVAPSHRRKGLAQRLLKTMLDLGPLLGCRDAWVLTSPANQGAIRLYQAAGGRRLTDPPAMFTFRLPTDAQPPPTTS